MVYQAACFFLWVILVVQLALGADKLVHLALVVSILQGRVVLILYISFLPLNGNLTISLC